MIPKDSYEIIDTLIKQGRSFAIWRIPSEDRLHFRMQSAGSPCLLYDIKDLNERSGFVIAPFQVTAERPIVLIQPDCFEIPSESDWDFSREKNEFPSNEIEIPSESEEKERYAYHFSLFTNPLLKGSQDKLSYPVAKRSGKIPLSHPARHSSPRKNDISAPMSTFAIPRKPELGWVGHRKSCYPARKVTGKR